LALVGEEAVDTPPAGESGRARLRGGPGVCSVDGLTAREEGSPIVFFGTVSEDPFNKYLSLITLNNLIISTYSGVHKTVE